MSRELLKRAYAVLTSTDCVVDELLWIDIEKVLAKPEPEPVAWVNAITGDFTFDNKSTTVSWAPLYLSPPKREPLSDADVYEIHRKLGDPIGLYDLTRAIEKAHGIGE
jgi:hypothetical protein